MEYQAFEKASHRILDSVWTMTFRKVGPNQVEILAFNREDDDGYQFERMMPRLQVNEGAGRIVESIEICGQRFDVENQKHVFSYN